MTNLISLDLEEVPDYAIRALIEKWEASHNKKLDQAVFCNYTDYKQAISILKREGLPHIVITRSILENSLEGNSKLNKRPLNRDVCEQCLNKWSKEDKQMYVLISLD